MSGQTIRCPGCALCMRTHPGQFCFGREPAPIEDDQDQFHAMVIAVRDLAQREQRNGGLIDPVDVLRIVSL